MSELFNTALVEKRNTLNAVRSNCMTLQELRFFSIYLSKINPWDKSTRVVRFPLDDFRRIMGIGSDMNITHFRYTIRHILQQVVEVPNEKGTGYTAFQLFKKAKIEKNENDEWYVEFDAHDDALPLMFDFKDRYFKYELWNALRLKSPNQVRMYEILKQYEGLGKRELPVTELRELLGIGKNEYNRWDNFKRKVLDSCQQALKECTDICYTYERGKVGQGGKWLSVVFHISKNAEYVDQLTLEQFIEQQPISGEIVADAEVPDEEMDDRCSLFADACKNEFSADEMAQILEILVTIPDWKLPPDNAAGGSIDLRRYHYLAERYAAMNRYKPKKRLKYLLKVLKTDANTDTD